VTADVDVAADLRRADGLREMRRPADAVPILTRIIAVDPTNVRALCQLAQCQLDLKRYDLMLAAADRAAGADPHSEWAHRLRAMALLYRGEHGPGMESARRAVSLAPNNWRCHVTLADTSMVGTLPEEKKAAYHAALRAVSLAPHQAGTHVTLGRVLLSIGENDRAREAFERALALDPANAAALSNLAITRLRRGRIVAAGRSFGEVAAANPADHLFAHNVTATAFLWVQRVIDLGVLSVLVQMVVALLVPDSWRVVTGLAVSALCLTAAAVMYARLPAPMRKLVLRARTPVLTRMNATALGGILLLLLWATAILIAGDDRRQILGLLPIWLIGFGWRLRYRFGPRLHWARQRRRYRTAVFGPTGGPDPGHPPDTVVAPRSPAD
jgi:Flp pilus assembly protein TadD